LSKGAEKLKAQMQERIDAAKAKLEDLKAQIRAKELEDQE
jgi:ABC-type Fe3+-hydroxamate transport system substrate-binding protein